MRIKKRLQSGLKPFLRVCVVCYAIRLISYFSRMFAKGL